MTRRFQIGSRTISDDSPPYVIAEIGHNHQGSVDLCKQMIRAASRAGADAVKLQKRSNRDLYTAAAYDAEYHGDNAFGRTYGTHREALEFGTLDYADLKGYSGLQGVHFFATAFDPQSADFLVQQGVPAIKMASGDITNTPLLGYVASLHVPMIVSTGTADQADVDRAVETISRHHQNFALLQCTAEYPCTLDHLNLRVIQTYRKRYPDTIVGLSYHGDSQSALSAAFGLGARIFELHFTFSRAMRGSDHVFSLEPGQLTLAVQALYVTRLALGTGEKRCLPGEQGAIQKMGKSLYAARPIKPNTPIWRDDIAILSPGGAGLPPYRINELLGKSLPDGLAEGEPFPAAMLGAE